jgi:hemolysin activation/secretion protein
VVLRALALVVAGVCACAAQAQPFTPPFDQTRPQDRPLPEFLPERPPPGFVLPPLPPPAADPPLSSGVRVRVARFRIVGNTVFSEDELRALIVGYEGREIGNEELEEARTTLTRHYIGHGYINSGAVIPDQQVRDGVITLRIIEGRLTDIAVGGDNRFHPDFVRERVRPPEEPLNVTRLQERVQILLQNPQIERINAELSPGLRPGEAVLGVDLKEAPWREIGYAIANDRSPSIGGVRQELRAALRNLSGRGEELSLIAGKTKGLDDLSVMLAVPVSARDTSVWMRFEQNDSVVIEPPFDTLGIEARSNSVEIGIRHPLLHSLSREIALGASLVRRDTESFLLEIPFSFSSGVVDGRSKVTALRITADLVERSTDQVSAARFTATRGLDAFDSTHPPFTIVLAQLQRVQILAQGRAQLMLRLDGQAAFDPLPPSEKFSLGGAESVRGYREDLLVRDSGWNGSLEYRHRIARLPIGFFSGSAEDGWVSAVPFMDAGQARDREGSTPSPHTLASIGLGVRWDIARGVQMAVYRGWPMREVERRSDDDLQDRGVHFRLSAQKAF